MIELPYKRAVLVGPVKPVKINIGYEGQETELRTRCDPKNEYG